MAKKTNKRKQQQGKKPHPERIVTMKDLQELSDDDSQELPPPDKWDDSAKRLQSLIESGELDRAIRQSQQQNDDDSFEEVELKDDEDSEEGCGSSSEEEEAAASDDEEQPAPKKESASSKSEESEDDPSESEQEEDDQHNKRVSKASSKMAAAKAVDASESEDDDDKEEEGDDNDTKREPANTEPPSSKLQGNPSAQSTALRVVTEALVQEKGRWPWPERFDVVQGTLPFGRDVSIHDDLKREVAFYDVALQAVLTAKQQCSAHDIPFTRPDDFFAEMVKTDDHMAKIKDRLIFETKKMEAVSQRKTNKEHKLRAKESQANRLAEKSQRKKDHFRQLDEWAQSAAANRGGKLSDHDAVDSHFSSSNKKRKLADKKYGFGGKRGRFKQNSPKSMNDMSGYNRRGNFEGGMKRTKTGSGANRKGKRARDARRSR